jgi:hypothetical protein
MTPFFHTFFSVFFQQTWKGEDLASSTGHACTFWASRALGRMLRTGSRNKNGKTPDAAIPVGVVESGPLYLFILDAIATLMGRR